MSQECALDQIFQNVQNHVSYDPPLDPEIRRAVEILNSAGIETFESCQGGEGHAYTEPTVRFHGDYPEGFKALSIALRAGLIVTAVRRTWPVILGEPTGPWWEMTFRLPPENRLAV